MTDPQELETATTEVLTAMREKLGVRSSTLHKAHTKAKRLLPRRVYRSFVYLEKSEPMLTHPRLRQTLDMKALKAAQKDVQTHLEGIDVADRRKGWWLNLAGVLAFNLLVLIALVIIVLVWRGYI